MADKKVLLVEGGDDEHVLYALLNHHAIPRVIRVKQKGGISNLLDTLDVELLGSELEQLGIMIDADVDIAPRWQRISQILRNAGYVQVPEVPEQYGTVLSQEDKPSVGIWIMPNNRLPGMLENFIQFLVPDGDHLWEQAGHCIDEIPRQDRLFPNQHLIKAQVHTWLAWQAEPGPPLGLAITKRYLEIDSPHAQSLVNWVRRLFNL